MAQVTRADNNGDFTIKTGTSNSNGIRTVSTGNLNSTSGRGGSTNVIGTGSSPITYKANTGVNHGLINNNPVSYGSSGGGDDGSARLQALRNAIEQSRDARLKALLKSLNLNIDTYENELGNLDRNYQNLIDQSEVERYKTRNYIREALANRGQMDSGYGRQEAMNSDIKYGNTINGIKAQREADRNTIRNAIASLKANYENDKANVNDQYNNSLLQLM